jgi:hypothetical protein
VSPPAFKLSQTMARQRINDRRGFKKPRRLDDY